jgi:hypothetical protein
MAHLRIAKIDKAYGLEITRPHSIEMMHWSLIHTPPFD